MNGAVEIGAIGLGAQQNALDIIANNIANINTPAFKRADVRFAEMIARADDPNAPRADLQSATALAGVSAQGAPAYDQQGPIEQTGRSLDLAIDGAGFIELLGPHGQSVLWRGGALEIGDDGQLTANGLPLRAGIVVPNGATDLQISADGVVTAHAAGSNQATQLGVITLVHPNDPTTLQPLDNGLFRVADGADTTEAAPSQDGLGSLQQGALERSNVNLNDEMVRLMMVQRAYAANAQVVQAGDQIMAIANNLRR